MMSLALMAFATTSCNNEDEMAIDSKKEATIEVEVPKQIFNDVNKKLNARLSLNGTRAGSSGNGYEPISEEEAQEILQPLVEYGEEVREELLQAAQQGELDATSEELVDLENMDDSQLAGLAYLMCSLDEITNDEPIDEEIIEEFSFANITRYEIVECLSVAMGFQLVSNLYRYVSGTAQLMTATEAFAIGKAFIKRTWGWVGAAYVAYEYGSCIHDKGKK